MSHVNHEHLKKTFYLKLWCSDRKTLLQKVTYTFLYKKLVYKHCTVTEEIFNRKLYFLCSEKTSAKVGEKLRNSQGCCNFHKKIFVCWKSKKLQDIAKNIA